MTTESEESRSTLERQTHQPLDLDNIQHLHPQSSLVFKDTHPSSLVATPPIHHPQHQDDVGRSLPKCPISDQNMADQYAAFILYCNPSIPVNTDTKELKSIFRSPPRSDGKAFSTWTLFELIKKLESKEIKTWAQLALDLGVEPPVLEKGQSAQKVQQYAVRLKRWMHAMHVDSFFEYLMNKPHPYWTHVPSIHETMLENCRDGVPAEEDLAIRALLPETRPKRGRRKNEDREESELGKSPAQRPRVDSPTLSEDFMVARASLVPRAVVPAASAESFSQPFDENFVPWSAMEARDQSGAFRWPPAEHGATPLSAYPQSAITPTSRTGLWNDEPQSAITPKSRTRRRHGPAVSSAWPGAGNASGRIRGRPPANRSTQDGPFSTFPANPTTKDLLNRSVRGNSPAMTPTSAITQIQHLPQPPGKTPIASSNGTLLKPGRLSLQVPQRTGGSVRLATPPPVPPTVLINGQEGSDDAVSEHTIQPQRHYPNLSGNTIHPQVNNAKPMSEDIAQQPFELDREASIILEKFITKRMLAAEFITSDGKTLSRCTRLEAFQLSRQLVATLQSEKDPHDTFMIFVLNLAALATQQPTKSLQIIRTEDGDFSTFEGKWMMGKRRHVEGSFVIKGSVPRDNAYEEDNIDGGGIEGGGQTDETAWREKYLKLRREVMEKDAKVQKLKQELLEAVSKL